MPPSPAARRRWIFLLRLLLGLLLLAWLVRSIGIRPILDAFALFRASPGLIAAALALTFLALLAGVVRWHALLRLLGLSTPFRTTFRAFFAGQFFNAFFFGACGGDLLRAVMAVREHPDRKTEAVGSVILDRGIGLLVTLLFGCLALLPGLRTRLADPVWHKISWLMAAFAILNASAAIATISDTAWSLAVRLAPNPAKNALTRLRTSTAYFRRHPRTILLPTLLSLANLLLLAAACHALSVALSLAIPWREWLPIFPVITVLSAIPLTPGSLGVREALFVTLLAPLGVPSAPALALSLLTYLTATLWSLFGGALLIIPSSPTITR